MSSTAADAGDDLWAVTCYFNPMRFRRRRETYRTFREHLAVPLVAVELSFGEFELAATDADILVRVGGGDVLWQKERLLNLAVDALPDGCEKVAWLDCDVLFEASDWHVRTSRLLDIVPLVQPFDRVVLTGPDWRPGEAADSTAPLFSVPFLVGSGRPPTTFLGDPAADVRFTPGHAWAARRDLVQRHGLYDACIVGGGDIAVARAAYGQFDDAIRRQYLDRAHYLAWARPFHEAVRSEVAHLDGALFHLWHGDVEHRRYRARNDDFSRFAFDPGADITVDAGGAWRWSSAKPEMHAFVRDYFAARREDG